MTIINHLGGITEMKTSIDYNFEKFKSEWGYDHQNQTIQFKNYRCEPERLNIDLNFKTPMVNHYLLDEEFTISVKRSTTTETGMIQIPRIHLDRDFFKFSKDIRNHNIHHEIGHYLLHSLNFSDPADILDTSVMHHEIYDYKIDLLITEKTKRTYERLRSLVHEICAEYENDASNIARKDLFFKLVEITESVFGKDFEANTPYSCLVNEIDAELFAYLHDKNPNAYTRYVLYVLPKMIHKYHKKIGHVIDENIETIENLAKMNQVLRKAYDDKIVQNSLWTYYIV